MSATVKTALQLVVGFAVAAGLMVGAILLWARTLIIFGAPLLVASLAAAWVTIDNVFVYRRRPDTAPENQEAGEPLTPPSS
ncbi:MAG TPA: hypothetical protein VNY76_09930 [Candidatus Acidoferrales bacterium]|nr:hypothetical protein [Candidatus Acidoferrales bacterium]